jgi:hypothetical protein
MDMQLYVLHVVPVVILFYGMFVLFMHPPLRVITATLAGGLVMALLNLGGDLAAIHTSLWYYSASGLVAQLPLPFYTTPLFISGGQAYLLIWRLWRSSYHWLALLFLAGVPLLGFLSNLWQGSLATGNSFLIWKSPLAWTADLVLWVVMFFAGYLVFRAIAPARPVEVKEEKDSVESTPAIEKQK